MDTETEGRVILRLVEELKAECNRYKNGACTNLSCFIRGGYTRGAQINDYVATCERHEQVTALVNLKPLERKELVMPKNHPIQPLEPDEHGVVRFKKRHPHAYTYENMRAAWINGFRSATESCAQRIKECPLEDRVFRFCWSMGMRYGLLDRVFIELMPLVLAGRGDRKMMTEKEAWKFLSEEFEADENLYNSSGLCKAVALLRDKGKIDLETHDDMRDKLKLRSLARGTVFLWPPEPEFRPHRAALARKLAEECVEGLNKGAPKIGEEKG